MRFWPLIQRHLGLSLASSFASWYIEEYLLKYFITLLASSFCQLEPYQLSEVLFWPLLISMCFLDGAKTGQFHYGFISSALSKSPL